MSLRNGERQRSARGSGPPGSADGSRGALGPALGAALIGIQGVVSSCKTSAAIGGPLPPRSCPAAGAAARSTRMPRFRTDPGHPRRSSASAGIFSHPSKSARMGRSCADPRRWEPHRRIWIRKTASRPPETVYGDVPGKSARLCGRELQAFLRVSGEHPLGRPQPVGGRKIATGGSARMAGFCGRTGYSRDAHGNGSGPAGEQPPRDTWVTVTDGRPGGSGDRHLRAARHAPRAVVG